MKAREMVIAGTENIAETDQAIQLNKQLPNSSQWELLQEISTKWS